MMTATWWENSALIVGRPRRSTEWSTESSCTSVARWISSTTAASVTTRGSAAPAAWWASSIGVGRNSLPFMRKRCAFTSAAIGKSAAMMRRSSRATCSSSSATGCCTSESEARAICWLTSLRLREGFAARADVQEADIHREHAPVQLPRLGPLALLLERPAEPVEDAEPFLVARGWQLERAPQDRLRDHVGALLHKAHAQRLRAAEPAFGRPQRLLQLADRLVEQAHLLERHTQIVVGLEVSFVDVLVDPLLEAGEHALKILLLVARGLLVGHLHAGVPRGRLLLEHHGAQVDEVPGVCRVLAHLHLRVPGSGLPFRIPQRRFALGLRVRRRRRDRGEHRERRGGAGVAGVVLGDALIHGSGLVGQVDAQQGVGELQVGVDQPRLVARLERELHVFLPVPHAVGIEPQDLVHQVARMDEVAAVLEPGGGEVELLDATRALTGLDQRLTPIEDLEARVADDPDDPEAHQRLGEALVRLGIIGIVGNAGLEVLDRGEVPRLLDL